MALITCKFDIKKHFSFTMLIIIEPFLVIWNLNSYSLAFYCRNFIFFGAVGWRGTLAPSFAGSSRSTAAGSESRRHRGIFVDFVAAVAG